jgi:hypothetical protein
LKGAIGNIQVRRNEVRAFSDRLSPPKPSSRSRTPGWFEEVQARNLELRDALEQQTATSELLKVIGHATFNIQPVFETLAENAVRLCQAERSFVFRFDGRLLRVVATYNTSRQRVSSLKRISRPSTPGPIVGLKSRHEFQRQ